MAMTPAERRRNRFSMRALLFLWRALSIAALLAMLWIVLAPLLESRGLFRSPDFYATCAQVIPVLLLAWALELSTRRRQMVYERDDATADELQRQVAGSAVLYLFSSFTKAWNRTVAVMVFFAELAALTSLAAGGAPAYVGFFLLGVISLFGILVAIMLVSQLNAHDEERMTTMAPAFGLTKSEAAAVLRDDT